MKSFRLKLLRAFGRMLGLDMTGVTFEDAPPYEPPPEPEYFVWRPDWSGTFIMGPKLPFSGKNDQLGPFPKSEAIQIMKRKNGIKP